MKGLVLLWCMFLLFGCGTKKQNYRSETVSTAVSSQKDSIGNQYIVKTTQMDIHSEQKRSVITEENSGKQETDTSIQVKNEGIKEVVTDDMLIDRRSVLPNWVSGLIVILFGCLG